MIPSRPFSGWKISYLRRPLVAMLLLVIVGSVGICHVFGDVSAEQEDIVQMSPGTHAHALGELASIVKLDHPKSSLMPNVTGEISLNLTLAEDVSSIAIYVPPEFSFLDPSTTSVWTRITNNYGDISIGRLSATDDIGRSWWKVSVVNLTIPMGSYAIRIWNIVHTSE